MHVRWEAEDLFPRLDELVDEDTQRHVAEQALAFKRSQPVA
jgi:hypothetical protein